MLPILPSRRHAFEVNSLLPNEISGLYQWLDANDNTTLFDSASGGSLVSSNGAIVRWEDKSGNNHHYAKIGNSLGPIRSVGAVNGLDVAFFDQTVMPGMGMILQYAWTPFSSFSGATVMFVSRTLDPANTLNPVNTLGGNYVGMLGSPGWTTNNRNDNTFTFATSAQWYGEYHIWIESNNFSSSGLNWYCDENLTSTATNTDKSTKLYPELGAQDYGGSVWDRRWHGNLCEVVIYNEAHSLATLRPVINGLKDKWGIV